MNITIPDLSLVLLVGISSSGKTTFARRHFKPTEVLSSDFCRGLVADDENDQSATSDAFAVLHFIAEKRLAAGRLTVVDATNVQPDSRKSLIALAQKYDAVAVAIVFDMPEQLCQERNRNRQDRILERHTINRQWRQLQRSLSGMKREGIRSVFTLSSPEEAEGVVLSRQPLWANRKEEHGPFDIIGDVHGCFDELRALIHRLGYQVMLQTDKTGARRFSVRHPERRRLILLGDLVDRGPQTPDVLRLVMDMVESGVALCVPGNHDMRLLQRLQGRYFGTSPRLSQTMKQLEQEPASLIERIKNFLEGLVSHYVLDQGKLVVAHAGMKAELQGRASAKVRDFALYGETTGETDQFGLPVRHNWAIDYRGKAMVVYGHTPVVEPEWLNRTINIDTGCVFGGRLTALRYPEKELVSVPALRTYAEPVRPLLSASSQHETFSGIKRSEAILDINDVLGKRIITTRLHRNITIREEQSMVAVEVLSRFAINPRWLIYLPPTIVPPRASDLPDTLEHPADVFTYYQQQGLESVVCQEKHMGSRLVMVVCRDDEIAQKRFGIVGEGSGKCYTRTGRPFFNNPEWEAELLARVRRAFQETNLWETLQTDWVCLDGELMPWSVKAEPLLRQQYAAVGSAATVAMERAIAVLEQTTGRGGDTETLLERYRRRGAMVEDYRATYRRYCWPVQQITDLSFAPFHLLASEGTVHIDKDHEWHMQTLATLCQADSAVLRATAYRRVELGNPESEQACVTWWEDFTEQGGEGIVIKPMNFLIRSPRGLIQPAVKCRGRSYLRIIYGPEYTLPEHLERLRSRNIGLKRSLALREFALGIEALERFVQQEPLYRVHECVAGILALESEPVDPRL